MRHYVNPIWKYSNGKRQIVGFFHSGKKYLIDEILRRSYQYWLLALQIRIGNHIATLYWDDKPRRWFVLDLSRPFHGK